MDEADINEARNVLFGITGKYLRRVKTLSSYRSDLMQVGEEAMLHALRTFDVSVGVKLTTYVYRCILNAYILFTKWVLKHHDHVSSIEELEIDIPEEGSKFPFLLSERLKNRLDPKEYKLATLVLGLPPADRQYKIAEIARMFGSELRPTHSHAIEGKTHSYMRMQWRKVRLKIIDLLKQQEDEYARCFRT